jgi:hypothetical protein
LPIISSSRQKRGGERREEEREEEERKEERKEAADLEARRDTLAVWFISLSVSSMLLLLARKAFYGKGKGQEEEEEEEEVVKARRRGWWAVGDVGRGQEMLDAVGSVCGRSVWMYYGWALRRGTIRWIDSVLSLSLYGGSMKALLRRY